MRFNKMMSGLIISLVVIFVLLTAADRRIDAQSATSDSAVSRKLDEVLRNQTAILDGIASIKQELDVIKVRVTR